MQPDIEGTRWTILLDIGRTTFTLMPMDWATEGQRLRLPVAVEFRPGGELAVLGVGSFLGDWLVPGLAPGPEQLRELLPAAFGAGRPSVGSGRCALAEDGLVHFHLETSGFRRNAIWLPRGKVHFRAKAYGRLLAKGNDAVMTIRENRAVFGALFGTFCGITVSTAVMVVCGLFAAFALRQVAVVVGRWDLTALEGEDVGEGPVMLPSVMLAADEPDRWR